jgi:hypothetical protein
MYGLSPHPAGINTVKPHPLMCLPESGSRSLSDPRPPGDWRISCRRGIVTTRLLSEYSTTTRHVQESGVREKDDSLLSPPRYRSFDTFIQTSTYMLTYRCVHNIASRITVIPIDPFNRIVRRFPENVSTQPRYYAVHRGQHRQT